MKLLRLTTLPINYLSYLYHRNKRLKTLSYEEQIENILFDGFAQADSYSYYLSKIGYECQEVIVNAKPLQRCWFMENGIAWENDNFIQRAAVNHVLKFQPDILFLNDFTVFDDRWVASIREICPRIRLVISWCGISIENYRPLSKCDLVLTSNRTIADIMKENGLPVEVLPFAFDPRILDRINLEKTAHYIFTFAGQVVRSGGFHRSRQRLIEELNRRLGLIVFTDSKSQTRLGVLIRQIIWKIAQNLVTIGIPKAIIRDLPLINRGLLYAVKPVYQNEDRVWREPQSAVYGLEMFRTLHASQVTLNMHAECAGPYIGNIRLFEATGVGVCLLTDWKQDLCEFFELDTEVVAYSSLEECCEKARWLLDHPVECKNIGNAAQRRVLQQHTYSHRAVLLDSFIRERLGE